MKRGQPYLSEREEQPFPGRQSNAPHRGRPDLASTAITSDQSHSYPVGLERYPMPNLPHMIGSPGPPQLVSSSPGQIPQILRPSTLPSPSFTNTANQSYTPTFPPISAATQNSAQASHLQDLQHQISVKTLAFQTLQREYDSLLQRLERQQIKCATLEKKFEVSDVEINTLLDDKEKLQAQVVSLEAQVEELQHSRDETRRELVANGAQYMRIVEMGNRLQNQGVEDRKRWEAERAELQQRIRVLEEAMVTGPDPQHDSSRPSSITGARTATVGDTFANSSSATETLNVLRNEVGRLRLRSTTLETALRTIREETVNIQETAKTLARSGAKLEDLIKVPLKD